MFIEILMWVLIVACFIIAYIGLVYPIIPGVLFVFSGFLIYGLFEGFYNLPWWFWLIQILLTALLFIVDFLANMYGVKKFQGSNAGMWGSTIGLIVMPFIIPFWGILIGPFLGAFITEIVIKRRNFKESVMSGIGSLFGLLTSAITKGIIHTLMILLFVIVIVLK